MYTFVAPWEEMKTPNPQDILPPLSFDTMHSPMHSDKHKDDDDIDTSDDDSTFYGSYNSHTDESSRDKSNKSPFDLLGAMRHFHGVFR